MKTYKWKVKKPVTFSVVRGVKIYAPTKLGKKSVERQRFPIMDWKWPQPKCRQRFENLQWAERIGPKVGQYGPVWLVAMARYELFTLCLIHQCSNMVSFFLKFYCIELYHIEPNCYDCMNTKWRKIYFAHNTG